MYKINLSTTAMKDLWILREFCGEAPISRQVQAAVQSYLEAKKEEIGCSPSDVQKAMQEHELEESKL